MSTSRAVARGTSRLLFGLLSAKGLDLLFYLLLARRLGVEQFGRYTYALSFTMLFSIVADMGLLTIFTREAARTPHRVRWLLGQVMTLKLALGLVTILASTGITLWTHAPAGTLPLVAIFTTSMLINSSAMLFDNLLKSAGRSGAAGLSTLAQSGTAIAVGGALLFSGQGAQGGAIAYLVASLIHLAVSALWARDLWSHDSQELKLAPESTTTTPAAPAAPDFAAASANPQPLWHGSLGLLREAAPLALSGAFIAVYFRIDSVLLNVFQGAKAVGLYGGVYRFFEAFVLLSAAYRSVLFPVMARVADGPAGSLGPLCRKSLRLHLMFTVGIAVFFTFQAKHIVTLVLGPEYVGSAPALAILMWALPGAFMADTLLHLLAAQRLQNLSARAVAITAVFNVVLNLIVIPMFSLYGAAVVTVLSELLSFGLMYAYFSRTVPRISLFSVARAPIIAGTISGAALVVLAPLDPGGAHGLLLMAAFSACAYVFALVALGAIGRQDIELVYELLPRAFRPRSMSGDRRKLEAQA
jgi:O-antigen/teichoic acid export membrane protein